jgi:molybdopterin-guanine dinucleotide biosynthesis protein A
MKDGCTGVILAGGRNSRLPGKKKGFRKINGEMIIEKILRELRSAVDEIIIVTNDLCDFVKWDAMIVSDIDQSRCALSGVHAGIYYASYDKVFITACDTPFITKDIIKYIISCKDDYHDVVIPEAEGGLETLLALYSKPCLPMVEKNLKAGLYMIKKFYSKKKVKKIPIDSIKKIDPEMKSFFNVNTPYDLEIANDMVKTKGVS